MKPLLAHIYEPHRVSYPCYVQPKLNGIRALYQNGAFQSRDQLPFPAGLLSHLAEPLLQIFGPEVILDGELYHHGWPLQRINAAVTPVRLAPTEDTLKVEYHVFDVVDFGKSFARRFCDLMFPRMYMDQTEVIAGNVKWVFHTGQVNNEQEANEKYAQFVSWGYEGMMYRLGDCPYTVPKQPKSATDWASFTINSKSPFLSDKDNRCWHLLKRKDWQDDEFECVAIQEGTGKLNGTLGALVCETDPFTPALFSVGSGLTDSERAHYWANPPIGRLVKVKYLVLSNDGIPLNPTILAIL